MSATPEQAQGRGGGRLSPFAVFLAIGGIYVAQSVIGGVTFTALPAVLRERNLPLDQIGLIYLAVLPWAIKFLWAPAVERYRLPSYGRNRSRIIVLAGGLTSAAGLALAGLVGLGSITLLLACLIVVAFAAATVDIACDGYAVEVLSEEHYGWGNAAQVGGAYLGAALGSGLFLILVEPLDWTPSVLLMALLIVLLGLFFVVQAGAREVPRQRDHVPSLRDALGRSGVRSGILLAVVYVAAQKWGQAMLGPFLVDSGVDLGTIGTINGLGGLCIGFAGAFLGGALVRRWGAFPVMIAGVVLQALAYGAFAALAFSGAGGSTALIVVLALASSSGIMAFSFVALYAQFMGLADPRQGGVDFTLFQCADALTGMLGGMGAGWLAQHFGHSACFAVSASVAVAALPVMLALHARFARPAPDQAAGVSGVAPLSLTAGSGHTEPQPGTPGSR